MRRVYLLCFFVFLVLMAAAQNSATDRLLHLLSSTRDDTSKANVLLQLSRQYTLSRPDTALLLARQAFDLCEKHSYKKGEAKALNNMANACLSVNNRPQALQYYLQALQIFEGLNDAAGIASCEQNIGMSYLDQQEYSLALTYLHQSKRMNEKLHNEPDLLSNLLTLGGCYESLHRLDSALWYTGRAYQLAGQLNDTEKKGMAARLLGDIYASSGQQEQAMQYYRLSLPLHRQAGNNYGISNATLGIAQLFGQKGLPDSALLYAQLALGAARQSGFPQLVLNATSFLADYFASRHQVDSAFAYQQVVLKIKDTLYSQQKVKSLQRLTFDEQARQQELALQKQKEAQERKVNLQLFGIAIFIPLFFALVLFLSSSNLGLRYIELLGTLSMLLLFEFIALFTHPYLEKWTHHTPVLMLLILVVIGAVLVPLHHKLEVWVHRLLLKRAQAASNEAPVTIVEAQQMKTEVK